MSVRGPGRDGRGRATGAEGGGGERRSASPPTGGREGAGREGAARQLGWERRSRAHLRRAQPEGRRRQLGPAEALRERGLRRCRRGRPPSSATLRFKDRGYLRTRCSHVPLRQLQLSLRGRPRGQPGAGQLRLLCPWRW